MINELFLTHLEVRARNKKVPFLATADEMERLQNLGRTFPVPPPRPCVKRAVVLNEITEARMRLDVEMETV